MNFTIPRLKAPAILIIGAVLAAMVAGGFYYLRLSKLMKVNKDLQASVDTLTVEGSKENEDAANKAVVDADKFVKQQTQRWTAVESRYFRVGPSNQALDLSNLLQANMRMSLEYGQVLAPAIRSWIESTGNRLVSGISVPSAVPDPNSVNRDPLTVTLNGVRVQGTFNSVMNLLRSTRTSKRLFLINGVGVNATATEVTLAQLRRRDNDTVTADLDITVYYFPRKPATVTPFPLPSGDAGAAGGGAMPGPYVGGRSGMPGMPGGPMPGGPPPPSGPMPAGAGAPAPPAAPPG